VNYLVSMSKIFIGVDGGSTKTHSVVMRQDGVVLGEFISGSTNINSVGRETAYKNFAESVVGALKNANVSEQSVTAVGIGMSGVDTPEEVEDRKKWVNTLFKRPVISNIQNDGVIALVSGTKKLYGIVIISGTGAIVVGINNDQVYRASGWGPILGDEGSGFCVGQDLLKAVCHNEDGGPDTILHKMVLNELKLPSARQIIDWTYKDTAWARIASLTPLVFQAANVGDKVAIQILEDNVALMIRNIKLVYKKAGFSSQTQTPIVLSGGNLTHEKGEGIYAKILYKHLEKEFKNIQILLPVLSAPVAAAYLAIEAEKKNLIFKIVK